MCAHTCMHMGTHAHTLTRASTCTPGPMHMPAGALACTQRTWSPRRGSDGEGSLAALGAQVASGPWGPVGSAEHGHTIRGEDHARGGLVGAREVVQALAVLVLLGLQHLLILLQAHHQALV